jgi:hypothetical protein
MPATIIDLERMSDLPKAGVRLRLLHPEQPMPEEGVVYVYKHKFVTMVSRFWRPNDNLVCDDTSKTD